MNQEFRSVLSALRQGSPVVLDVPADVRYHLLHRYTEVSVRNGRLALASFALMLFGIAYEAPLVARLLALLAMAAIIAVRSRLSAALLQRMDPDDPQPDDLNERLVLAAMGMWNAAPFALESVVSPPNLAVVSTHR